MYYDWPKILKNKSDFELYDIYNGKTQLPKEVRDLAKEELIDRKFDFENITKIYQKKRIVNLDVELIFNEYLKSQSRTGVIVYSSMLCLFIFAYVLNLKFNFIRNFDIEFFWIGVLSFLFLILIDLLIISFRKKRKQKLINEQNRISKE